MTADSTQSSTSAASKLHNCLHFDILIFLPAFPLFFPFKLYYYYYKGNLRGSGYSASEHHTVNLMIASTTPLDFIINKRRTTAVRHFHFIQYRLKIPVLIRQWGPSSIHPPLHFSPSISLTSNSVSVVLFSTHHYSFSSLALIYISSTFFSLFSILSFLPPRWLHRATSCLRTYTKHNKEEHRLTLRSSVTLNCILQNVPHVCMSATAVQRPTRADKSKRPCRLSSAD